MAKKTKRFLVALFMATMLLGALIYPISAETTEVGGQQNLIVYYSLVPSLLMLNVVTPTVTTAEENRVEITAIPGIISIYRVSGRD